jgi:hypothetical protein
MDKITGLVSAAEFAMCIFANYQTGEFALADLGPAAIDVQMALIVGGMRLVGAAGVVDGHARVALSEPLDDGVLSQLAAAFCARFEQVRDAGHEDKSAAWLEALHSLPDTRN